MSCFARHICRICCTCRSGHLSCHLPWALCTVHIKCTSLIPRNASDFRDSPALLPTLSLPILEPANKRQMMLVRRATTLLLALLALTLTLGVSATSLDTCLKIGLAISNASEVFYPRECARAPRLRLCALTAARFATVSLTYASDNYHWMTSSSQSSACTVEPGTAADVGKIVRAFPFANSAQLKRA